MQSIVFFFLLNFIVLNHAASSFDLILNIDGNENYFRFIEVFRNSSSVHAYQSDDHPFGIATRINRTSVLFAVVQLSNGDFYEIIPLISMPSSRSERSLNNEYIVKHNGSIVKHASVAIQWNYTRHRRAIKKPSKSIILKKSRHISLEITAIIDSLILNDLRTLLNSTEHETIEILKHYYTHIFIGVEQLYRQSLINQTLDVHIRLSKIIFSTDKHRLPWESLKNISYRQNPNNPHLRPNITVNILKILHQAYSSNRLFDLTADHIMTFTRLDLADGSGSAYVSGVCSPMNKYSIIQEDFNSFSTMMTAAHELGHNLGLNHDEIENECNDPKVRYIMSPKNIHTIGRRQVPYFSKCSIKQLNHFVDKTTSKCWKNKIISTANDTKFHAMSTKLGQIINLRQQCQLQYGLRAIPFISISLNRSQTLYEESVCSQLTCLRKPTDDVMYWQDGAYDGTPCGENRICSQKKCVKNNEKIQRSRLDICPYGDLFVPVAMLNLKDKMMRGNMLCPDALNLLRTRGMNVTYLCYKSTLPYRRLCCEECKKHLIPECGDLHSKCSTFAQYCQNKFIRIDGKPPTELCPYTCGKCPPPPPLTNTITKTKTRKYIKPKKFTEHTCIDMADCSQLIKIYSKLNKKVTNWCTEYSTMIKNRYFIEWCPKYCSLCKITSECDRYKLCRNNGKCIRDEYGTYQCICSSTKSFYGTLCEYRRTCLNKPCSSKMDYCIQTHGENYVCLSKTDKEQMRVILNSTSKYNLNRVP